RYTRSGLPQDATRLTEWQAGRLTQQDNTHYQYDKAGRLIRKQVVQPGYRPQVWHYRWDSRNQLRVVDTPAGERWFYRYDPFGRRIGKRCDQTHEDIRYLWDGDQIAEVRHHRGNQLINRRHWIHNGWELLVQQRQTVKGDWETDFVTSGHNGEPQAVFNPQGELRWQAPRTNLWGQRYTDNTENLDPGLAFAGQYRDAESNLCYNRFRYYDPSGGCYISPDPISILGGEGNYAYVPNPIRWIDPFGLVGCGEKARKYEEKIQDMYGGKLPQSAREYSSIVNGNKVNGIADHVVSINGRNTAIEAKYVEDWGRSIRNPESAIGGKSFAIKEQEKMVAQAQKYSAAFDDVIYHTNSRELANYYGSLFQDAGLNNVIFRIFP
ncbi:RHS repeat domain-containing protein, partial [Pectobacterium parmentieri]